MYIIITSWLEEREICIQKLSDTSLMDVIYNAHISEDYYQRGIKDTCFRTVTVFI